MWDVLHHFNVPAALKMSISENWTITFYSSLTTDEIFMPKSESELDGDVDDFERELEEFKRQVSLECFYKIKIFASEMFAVEFDLKTVNCRALFGHTIILAVTVSI